MVLYVGDCVSGFFFEEITRNVDEGRDVDIVCMNFCKAFYKVLHGKLLWMVRLHGIQRELASWR